MLFYDQIAVMVVHWISLLFIRRKSYIYIWEETLTLTSSQILNIKAILTVMNTTELVVKIRPEKKFRPIQDLNPWPLQYQCSALPTELTSQLGASIAEVMVQISYKPEFYFRPYFTTSLVVFITVRIASIFVSSTTVHIHYFHIITIMY